MIYSLCYWLLREAGRYIIGNVSWCIADGSFYAADIMSYQSLFTPLIGESHSFLYWYLNLPVITYVATDVIFLACRPIKISHITPFRAYTKLNENTISKYNTQVMQMSSVRWLHCLIMRRGVNLWLLINIMHRHFNAWRLISRGSEMANFASHISMIVVYFWIYS